MGRKGENIFLRKDGRWEARYIKNPNNKGPKTYGYIYGKTYTEVKRKRVSLLLGIKENTIDRKYNFNELSRLWLNSRKITIKSSTYRIYNNIIEKYLIPYFKNYKAIEITEDIVNEFTNQLLQSEKKLTNKTIRNILLVLNQILNYAKVNIKFTLPKNTKKEVSIITKEDQLKLEKILLKDTDNLKLGIILSLYMGLRIGEVCALSWKDIDLKNHNLNINHTISRINNTNKEGNKTINILSNPKTEYSKRTIPIPNFIYKIMVDLKKDGYLLTNNNKYIETRSYYNYYNQILKKAKISKYKYHSLRHTFATRCIENNCDPKTLSELLGHSNIKITLSLYVHPSNEHKKEYMQKLHTLSKFISTN